MSHYDTLEVPMSASMEEIKKSYRKLAHKWHPDRNKNGADRFKEINASYEILSDPGKRRQYDLSRSNPSGLNGGSFFQQFFPQPIKIAEDIITYDVGITLEQICQGKRLNISYMRRGICPDCQGEMSTNRDAPSCSACNGSGAIKRNINMMGLILPQTTTCHICKGRGKIIRPVEECLRCNCTGHAKQKSNVILECKNFADHLTSYLGLQSNNLPVQTFREKGHYNAITKKHSSLKVLITIKPHPRFTVSRLDLCCDHKVSCYDALVGFSASVRHPNGEDIDFVSPKGVVFVHDQKFKIPNCGIPANDAKGDLYVKIKISSPCKITHEQQNKIRDVLKNNS